MPITRYKDRIFAPFWTNEQETQVDIEDDRSGIVLTVDVENYGDCHVTTEERTIFLTRDDAIEMAKFILEELKD